MKRLAFALLMAAASLAPAAVINVEFKFTPFVGDSTKDDKVTTVPGKAAIFKTAEILTSEVLPAIAVKVPDLFL